MTTMRLTPPAPVEQMPTRQLADWKRFWKKLVQYRVRPDAAYWDATDWFIDARRYLGPPPHDEAGETREQIAANIWRMQNWWAWPGTVEELAREFVRRSNS
jgi:hypothetical protein